MLINKIKNTIDHVRKMNHLQVTGDAGEKYWIKYRLPNHEIQGDKRDTFIARQIKNQRY